MPNTARTLGSGEAPLGNGLHDSEYNYSENTAGDEKGYPTPPPSTNPAAENKSVLAKIWLTAARAEERTRSLRALLREGVGTATMEATYSKREKTGSRMPARSLKLIKLEMESAIELAIKEVKTAVWKKCTF